MQMCGQSRAANVQFIPLLVVLKQNCCDQRMRAAIDFLLILDLKQEFRTEHLSHHLNLSTSRVLHLFHQHFGFSPLQALKARRMREARKLLHSSFTSVKGVMVAVGLKDPSHFGRDFKLMYGQSPSELLKHARRENAAANVRAFMEGELRDVS